MESSCCPFDREKAVGELLQGRLFAFQLKASLLQSQATDTQHLLLKIFDSFTNTLSILDPSHSGDLSHFPATSDARMSQDSGDSCRGSSVSTDRRGRYKRRKTSHSWTKETPNLIDDGHAWRKYGQKPILNAKYPRNYYRCTYKYDQGCQANKQVQRIQEDPPLYRTIYNGNHTCTNFQKADHLYLDTNESDAKDSSILLSFNGTNDQNHPFFTSSLKMEQSNDNQHPLASHDQAVNNSSSSCTSTADDHCNFIMDLADDVLQYTIDV